MTQNNEQLLRRVTIAAATIAVTKTRGRCFV